MQTHNTDKIIVFKEFNDYADAGFAQAKLKEAGIESFLENENVAGLNPLAGIELKIFSKDKEKVAEILIQ
ncbi:MAG: hypothetical protein WBP16_17220 [Ferruginibacter sp.]